MGIPPHRILVILNYDYHQIYTFLHENCMNFLMQWDENIQNIKTEFFDFDLYFQYKIEDIEESRPYINQLPEKCSLEDALKLCNEIINGQLSYLKLYEYDYGFKTKEYAEYLLNKYNNNPKNL